MKIFTDAMEDDRFVYARKIEQAANARFQSELVPNSLEVSRCLWSIRNRRRNSDDKSIVNLPAKYSEGWGYHISPDLFLTVAAICDQKKNLLRVVSAESATLELVVNCVDKFKMLEGDGLFELGGTFLDLMVSNSDNSSSSTKPRSYDAKFGEDPCLTVDSPMPAACNLQIIMANALFEETSGIIRTLVDGPASGKELRPVFKSLGYG